MVRAGVLVLVLILGEKHSETHFVGFSFSGGFGLLIQSPPLLACSYFLFLLNLALVSCMFLGIYFFYVIHLVYNCS